jgi:hypothetical protein
VAVSGERIGLGRWRQAVIVATGCWLVFKVASSVLATITLYGPGFVREVLHHPKTALVRAWDHWDSGWYVGLAQQGYSRLEHVLIPPGHYQDGVAFAPGLPFATRAVAVVTHLDALTASLVVVTVCLLVALVGLYRLVEIDFGPAVAGITLLLVLVFPGSMFFNAPYSEALVLMGCVWAVLLVRMNRLPLAAIFAAVAIMSKVAALVILPLMLIEYMLPRLREEGAWRRVRTWLPAAWLGLALLPLVGWMVYLQQRFGNALAFLSAHQQWNHHLSPPWTPVLAAIGDLVTLRMFDPPHGVVSLMDLLSLLALLAVSVYVLLRVRWSYGVFCLLAVLALTTSGLMDSMTRHILLAFPAFIGLAVLAARRPWLERFMLVMMAPASAYLLSRFVSGQWAG